MLDQLGTPADGPADRGRRRRGGRTRPRPSRAVAGDGPGIAFNAEAVTVAAQIVAAEASWRAAGGPAVVGPSDRPAGAGRGSWSRSADPSGGSSGSVAGRMPALRVRRSAGGTVERERATGAGGSRGTRPRRAGAGRDAGPLGVGGRPAPDGPAGEFEGRQCQRHGQMMLRSIWIVRILVWVRALYHAIVQLRGSSRILDPCPEVKRRREGFSLGDCGIPTDDGTATRVVSPDQAGAVSYRRDPHRLRRNRLVYADTLVPNL